MNAIFAPFFTKTTNFSQHDSVGCKADNFDQIKKWYESLNGMNAFIFHNECTNEFVKKHSKTTFVPYYKSHRPSYNDERFYCYKWYMNKHPEIENVFLTDIFDVEFFGNPFDLMEDKYELYIGTEPPSRSSRRWLNRKMKEVGFNPLGDSEVTYNAGIIGGHRSYVMPLIENMIAKFGKIDPKYNANMPVLNQCLRKYDKSKIMTGFPLHNKFKSNSNKEKACIKHK